MPRPEDQLFARFVDRRDGQALGACFDAVAGELLAVARHLCGRVADAEDLLQQTFLCAIEGAASWDRRRPLFGWLVGILTNQARLARRAAARTPDAARLPQPPANDPARAAAAAEAEAAVAAAVAQLGEAYRPVLHLHLVHGLQAGEIAQALGRPRGSVRTQLMRGLGLLRRALPAGLGVAIAGGVGAGRGLAAVRAAVVERGTAAAAAAGGGAMGAPMIKVLLAAGACLLLLLFAANSRRDPRPGDHAVAASASLPPAAVADPGATAPGGQGDPGRGGEMPARREAAAATGSLRVEVRFDRSGDPAVGVLVRAGDEASGTWVQARTDADGVARFAALPPGAEARPGSAEQVLMYEPLRCPRVVAGIEVAAEFVLLQGGEVRGTVTDERGLPLAGAGVWIDDESNRPQRRRCAGLTDAEGRFALPFERTEQRVCVALDGYCSEAAQGLLPASIGRDGERRFVLRRGGSRVQGVLADADGAAVAAAPVRLLALDGPDGRGEDGMPLRPLPARFSSTDANGAFAFAGLPAGRWQLAAVDAPAMPREVLLAAGATRTVDLQLRTAQPIAGSVRGADGAAVADASVSARALPPEDWQVDTRTAADGSYRLVAFRGPFELRAGDGRRGSARWRGEAAPPRIDLQLQAGTRFGTLCAADGALLRGWNVALGDRWMLTNGAAEFAFAADARGQLSVWPPLGDSLRPLLQLPWPAAGERIELPLDLLPRASVQGTVLSADGHPARGARVQVQGGGQEGDRVVGDADGWFRLWQLPVGDFELAIAGEHGAPALVPFRIDAPGQHLHLGAIALKPAGRLRLDLRRDDGSAWSGPMPQLGLRHVDGGPTIGFTFADGVATSRAAPPGRYRLGVERDLLADSEWFEIVGGAATDATVRLAIGREVTLQFALAAGDCLAAGEVVSVEIDGGAGRRQATADARGAICCKLTLGAGEHSVRAAGGERRWLGQLSIDPGRGPRCIDVPRLP